MRPVWASLSVERRALQQSLAVAKKTLSARGWDWTVRSDDDFPRHIENAKSGSGQNIGAPNDIAAQASAARI
jgi:hypothetical protein